MLSYLAQTPFAALHAFVLGAELFSKPIETSRKSPHDLPPRARLHTYTEYPRTPLVPQKGDLLLIPTPNYDHKNR